MQDALLGNIAMAFVGKYNEASGHAMAFQSCVQSLRLHWEGSRVVICLSMDEKQGLGDLVSIPACRQAATHESETLNTANHTYKYDCIKGSARNSSHEG